MAYEMSFKNVENAQLYWWSGKMQPIVESFKENRIIRTRWECQIKSPSLSLILSLVSLPLGFPRLQFIFFRLSIFNEVISFSIKHIPVRQ